MNASKRFILIGLVLTLVLGLGATAALAQDDANAIACDDHDGDPLDYFERRAFDALDAGDDAAAVDYLRCYLEYAPDAVVLQTMLAETYERLGQCTDALEVYAVLIKFEPDNPIHLYNRDACLRAVGTMEQVLENYDLLLASVDDETAIFLRLDRVDYLRRSGHIDAAVADLRDIVAENIFFQEELVYVLNTSGYPEEARVMMDDMLREDPTNAYILSQRGINNYLAHDYDAALADFEESYALNPHTFPLSWQAWIYTILGDFERALGLFQDCLDVSDRYTFCYFDRAITYYAMGDKAAAEADFLRAIDLEPDYSYSDQHNGDSSSNYFLIRNYSQMLEAYPDNVYALYFRGTVYAYQGEYALALADFRLVSTLAPQLAVTYRSLGDIYYQQGRVDEAVAVYQQYIEVAANPDPFILVRLETIEG